MELLLNRVVSKDAAEVNFLASSRTSRLGTQIIITEGHFTLDICLSTQKYTK